MTCFEGTPAEKAGLLPGDILYSVNDIEVTGKDLTDVVSLIKTAKGDTVHLTIARGGEKDYLEFDVERSDVAVPTVAYKMLDDEIGYIAVSEFDKVTAEQFKNALAKLEEQGMEKLIIDLRNNLGGVLDTCCEMLKQMLPKGLIVYTEDKYGQRTAGSAGQRVQCQCGRNLQRSNQGLWDWYFSRYENVWKRDCAADCRNGGRNGSQTDGFQVFHAKRHGYPQKRH